MVDLIVSMICSVDGFAGVDREEADKRCTECLDPRR